MTFFTKSDIGRVYVIRMLLPDGTAIWKIGMCHSSRSVDRMMEILRSWFSSYRFIPYTELRLDLEVDNPLLVEKHIHKVLAHKQWMPDKKISGGTEMFTEINEFRVIQYLRHCSKSLTVDFIPSSETGYRALGQLVSL